MLFFEATLQSLFLQKNQLFNIYIGNDNSPEDPTEILQKYNKKLNIKYKSFSQNVGQHSLVKHWERCISMVGKEEWLMILGDDDLLESNVVSSFYQNLPVFSGKSNVIRFSSKVMGREGHLSKPFQHPKWEDAQSFYVRKARGITRGSLSEFIFRKSSYKRFGFWDYPLGWHSDDRAWLEFSLNRPIYSINEAEVIIRESDISISGKTDNFKVKNQATRMFLRFLIKNNPIRFEEKNRFFLLNKYENLLIVNRILSIQDLYILAFSYFDCRRYKPFVKFLKKWFKQNISLLKFEK